MFNDNVIDNKTEIMYLFLEKILCCCLICLIFVSTGLSQNLKKGKNEVFIATGDGLDGYEDILAKKPVTARNISAKLYLPSTCNKKNFLRLLFNMD